MKWCATALAVGMAASTVLLPMSGPWRADGSAGASSDNAPIGSTDMHEGRDGASTSRDHRPEEAVIAMRDRGETEQTLRAKLHHTPNDQTLRQQLIELIGERVLPRDSAAYRSTRAVLPARFIEHETRRFIVFSDADSNWTRLQAERLDRAHHQFTRFARQLDLQPLPLKHKLVCVLFQNHEEYLEFAARHDGVNARWIGGYYAPQHDRIVFYNVESGEAVHRARRQLADMNDQLDALRRQADAAHRAGDRSEARRLDGQAANITQHLRSQQDRLDTFTAQTVISTTIHEAVHQLAFHTLVQMSGVAYPLWISEGLATAFETDRPNHAFGPAHEHDERRAMFQELLADDRLIPLRTLAGITDMESLPREAVTAMYHQSCALITWLHRYRRNELAEYLRLMRAAPRRLLSETEQINRFESAFGSIEQLERAWLRHERSR